MRGKRAFALLMEMRTGKTKVIIDDWGEMEDAGFSNQMLVIAPGGVYEVWQDEFKTHCDPRLLKRLPVLSWRSNRTETFNRNLHNFMSHAGSKVLLINVEALSNVQRAQDAVIDFSKQGPTTGVIDESTILKGHDSKRTKFVNGMRQLFAYRRILTGLPTPQSPLDLYSQYEFLDPKILGFNSFYGFRGRFAIIQPVVFPGNKHATQLIKGFRDLDELQARIAPYSYRVRLRDCYDMPPEVYGLRHVTLTDEQQRVYTTMKKQMVAELAGGELVTVTAVMTKILRLHQILCGHLLDNDGVLHDLPENRTQEVLNALEEIEGKVVIWCAYDHSVRRVSEALRKKHGPQSVAQFWGGNVNKREGEEKRFKNDPECKFMVATPGAGGRGRDWSIAHETIYHSCTPNLEHRMQSEDRTKKVDKVTPSAYTDLLTPGTVEEKYIKLLRKKIDLSTVITGDNFREWLI